jgi:hypothetical protein
MWGGRYFSSVCMSLKGLAPRAGLEPATFRLTAERSTIELPGSRPYMDKDLCNLFLLLESIP